MQLTQGRQDANLLRYYNSCNPLFISGTLHLLPFNMTIVDFTDTAELARIDVGVDNKERPENCSFDYVEASWRKTHVVSVSRQLLFRVHLNDEIDPDEPFEHASFELAGDSTMGDFVDKLKEVVRATTKETDDKIKTLFSPESLDMIGQLARNLEGSSLFR